MTPNPSGRTSPTHHLKAAHVKAFRKALNKLELAERHPQLARVLRLIVVHHHYRPGGVRRVIEVSLPHLIAAAPAPVTRVVLVGGEDPEPAWRTLVESRIAPVPVACRVEPAVGYRAELDLTTQQIRGRVRHFLAELLTEGHENDLVWAHNLGLGRNLVLSEELPRAAARAGIRLIAHHHDWWFDNRWQRWPELQRSRHSLPGLSRALLPRGRSVVHAAITRGDARMLRRAPGARAVWLPNPVEGRRPISRAARSAARRWLAGKLDGDTASPVWLMPCRFLRRKNMLEAVLLARWLRPASWLVTTAAASSEDEQRTLHRVETAARNGGWRVRFGVLAEAGTTAPGVEELLAASEAVLFTSILEGFGLPYLEAAAANRPLIARSLANVMPDLRFLGFRFPTTYQEVWVAPGLFDWDSEWRRQERLFREWIERLPASLRGATGTPFVLARATARPVPFSRLTLSAQLEVLHQTPEISWKASEPLNPALANWRRWAAIGKLPSPPWRNEVAERLSGPRWGQQFWARTGRAFRERPAPGKRTTCWLSLVMRERLDDRHLYPLLWGPET